jgi:hypothetical protein
LLRLARDRALASEARVLYATADVIEMGMPLAAARVLLGGAARGVAPDGPARLGLLALDGALAEPSGSGSRTDEVVHALWWLIVELADERPLVLLLDDAQWADDVTLCLLRMVARRAPELSLALVVAARPAAPGGRHAMLAAEHAFMRIEPTALSIAAHRTAVREGSGLRARSLPSLERVPSPVATRCICLSCCISARAWS